MLLSAFIVFFLAPLAVYSKLAFKSFKYEKGVAYTVIKAWDNAPPTFAVNLTHPGWDCQLAVRAPDSVNIQVKDGAEGKSGGLNVTVPSDTPPGDGYRMKLVSDDPKSNEVFDTSDSFEIKEGDFD